MTGSRVHFLQAVARLRDGVILEQARAQLNTVMDGIRRSHPQFTQNATAGVQPLKALLTSDVERRLLVLMGAVGFVLLIACANLGNLLLGRAAVRRREIALRQTLGARTSRVVRQLLTESVLLSALGGVLGLALGVALFDVLLTSLPEDLPRTDQIGLHPPVLLFSAGASLLAGLAFGLIPALHLIRGVPAEMVREGSRSSGRTSLARLSLVTSEVALAFMLLAGAGLLIRSFVGLLDVAPGFSERQLLTFNLSISTLTYREPAERVAFFERVTARLRQLPEVRAVTRGSTLPVAGRGTGAWFNRLDRPWPADQTPPAIPYRVVDADYFSTLGIPLLRGRAFTSSDRLDATRAVIVSESVAQRFWPDEDPLGRLIYLGAPNNRLFPDAAVVGIVGDVKQSSLVEARSEAIYIPHALMPGSNGFSFALRTSGDPIAVTSAARAEVRRVDPTVPMFNVRTIDEVMSRSVASQRSSMLLVGLFAALALVLAVLGVFGVLSYSVQQRRKEIGIRLALGATVQHVRQLVLVQGMLPVVAGVVVGVAGALALGKVMESLLFEVRPTDPITYAAVTLLLMVVAAMAAYVPARRATFVDPVTVLRQS